MPKAVSNVHRLTWRQTKDHSTDRVLSKTPFFNVRPRRRWWLANIVRTADERGLVLLPRKEVIQPHLPVRLPCYDLVPLTGHSFEGTLLAVKYPPSGAPNSGDLTGGVYKTRERIHPAVMMSGY